MKQGENETKSSQEVLGSPPLNYTVSRVLEELSFSSPLCVLCTADFGLHCSAGIAELAGRFGVGTPTLQHIIDGLKQPTDHDIRVSKYTA